MKLENTSNRQSINNHKMTNFKQKRLNSNNFKRNKQVQPKNFQKIAKSQPNFLDILSEYKRIRHGSRQQENPIPSTSKAHENQENNIPFNKSYQSVTAMSDDDLEEGEIVEIQKSQCTTILDESLVEIQRSNEIIDKNKDDLSKVNQQPLFYVDKSAANDRSEVPLYKSFSDSSGEVIEIDDSVILVESCQSDDSVIIIDDKPNQSRLNSPKEFISLSPIRKESNDKPELGKTRKERQKERFKSYKQKRKVKKVLELQSNGMLEGMTIRLPSIFPTNLPNSSSLDNLTLPSTSEKSKNEPSTSNAFKAGPSTSNAFKAGPSTSETSSIPSTSTQIRQKRIILIDGSNIALSFTASNVGKKAMVNNNKEFSAEALKKVITYFEQKEFKVKAVVPEFRVRREKSSNHDLMVEMLDSGQLITTPSKSYDDLILLESAAKLDAAIVSNDLFRDIRKEEFKTVIENRQIRYNWVFGELILAEDPYGRTGPKLDDILFKSI